MKLLLCFALLAAVATVHTLPSGAKKNTYLTGETKNGGNARIAVGEPHPDNDVKDQGTSNESREENMKDNKRKMYNVKSLSKGVKLKFNRKQTAKICLGEDSNMYVMFPKTIMKCKKEVGLNKVEQKDDMDLSGRKISMCERKEQLIKKLKMKKCIMDKMEWVDFDGRPNMEKIQSSYAGTKMEDMFMKMGDKTFHKCVQNINFDEVEEKLKQMNVETCQRDLGAENESSEEDSSYKQAVLGMVSDCINKAYLRTCEAYMKDILLSEEEMY